MTNTNLVDPANAGNAGYGNVINTILAKGVCPFCPENFHWHENPIIKQVPAGDNYWFITKNSWPYENSRHHFIIIGSAHITEMFELTSNDFSCVQILVKHVMEKYGISGGALMLRFGETLYTGATVVHLHFHFIVPKVEDGKALPVWFPVG